MSAAKARKSRKVTPKPESEVLPLAGVSITITKPRLFSGDEETVTFAGEHLASAPTSTWRQWTITPSFTCSTADSTTSRPA